jgi:hypothetical protein
VAVLISASLQCLQRGDKVARAARLVSVKLLAKRLRMNVIYSFTLRKVITLVHMIGFLGQGPLSRCKGSCNM